MLSRKCQLIPMVLLMVTPSCKEEETIDPSCLEDLDLSRTMITMPRVWNIMASV
jgi:hypothetical protein